jgi:hypothetical protein
LILLLLSIEMPIGVLSLYAENPILWWGLAVIFVAVFVGFYSVAMLRTEPN